MTDAETAHLSAPCLHCAGTGVRYNPQHRAWQLTRDRKQPDHNSSPAIRYEIARYNALMSDAPPENLPCGCRTNAEANAQLHNLLAAIRDAVDDVARATRSWHRRTDSSTSHDRQHVTQAITTLSWMSAVANHTARRLIAELEQDTEAPQSPAQEAVRATP